MTIEVKSEQETKSLGEHIGALLRGGEVIELVGDVGAGKTTFTKGLAKGLGIQDPVQSPSFTISQMYEARDGLRLAHYDFYRLQDAGIMAEELLEVVSDDKTITVVEWADTVEQVLPENKYLIRLTSHSEEGRLIELPDTLGAKL